MTYVQLIIDLILGRSRLATLPNLRPTLPLPDMLPPIFQSRPYQSHQRAHHAHRCLSGPCVAALHTVIRCDLPPRSPVGLRCSKKATMRSRSSQRAAAAVLCYTQSTSARHATPGGPPRPHVPRRSNCPHAARFWASPACQSHGSSRSCQITSADALANTLNLASPARIGGQRPQARIMSGASSMR